MSSIHARLRQKVTSLAVGITLLLGVATVATAAPVSAANTYVWNDVRGSVQAFYLPNQDASNYFNVPNGERFVMNCWLDNAGHRWFYGQTWSHGWGYIWSNWVYNQTTVPHC